MSELHTRKEKRTPVTLKIKFKSATLDQFIERYSVDVSHGGIFIRTKDPLGVGTQLRFEFQLQDASPLISGDGTVVWTREFDPSRVGVAPGMGVRFDRLATESQPVLDQILTRKTGGRGAESSFEPAGGSSPGLSHSQSSGPVTGEKTRITPPTLASSLVAASSRPVTDKPALRTTGTLAPVAKSIFGVGGVGDEQKDNTPLPKPMPFHVAAEDEFNEDVFEQPTKVASIDSLIRHEEEHARAAAEAAAAARVPASPELDEELTNVAKKPKAGARSRSAPPPVVEPPRKTEPPLGSVPLDSMDDLTPMAPPRVDPRGATMPPHAGAPSPITVAPVSAPVPVAPSPMNLVPSRAGSEPRFLENLRSPGDVGMTAPRRAGAGSASAAAAQAAAPPPKAKSASTMPILLATAALLAGAAAVYWFVIRPMDEPPPSSPRRPTTAAKEAPAAPTPPPLAATKPADPPATTKPPEPVAPPPPPATPRAVPVDVVVETRPEKAELMLAGGSPQPSPSTFKLEPGKSHQIVASAPCFKDETISVEPKASGPNKTIVKLKPLERVVRVSTDPVGANVIVDNRLEGKSPVDVKLVGRLDARNPHVFTVRKVGFQETVTRVLPDAPCATDGDLGVVGLSLTLAPVAVRRAPPPPPAPARRPAVAAPTAKPPAPAEPKAEPVVAKPEEEPKPAPAEPSLSPKAEPVVAKPEAPKPIDPPLPTKPEEKPEPKAEPAKPVAAEPKAEPPPAPKPEPSKPEQKDCDPSPDAPEWARCK